jgi:Na+-driven multidrug efflux pump
MICAEWWCFEMFILASSYIGVIELAANAITLNIAALSFMVPLGFQEGISSLVGSSIGANNVTLAKQITRFTFMLSYVCSCLVALSLFIFRVEIAELFTTDAAVKAVLLKTLPFYAFMYLPDAVQGLLSGAVRGLGLQSEAASFVLFAYWCVGLPVGLLCAFYFKMNIMGLWYGLLLAVTFQALFFLKVLVKADWQGIANRTMQVMEELRVIMSVPDKVRLLEIEGQTTSPRALRSPSLGRTSFHSEASAHHIKLPDAMTNLEIAKSFFSLVIPTLTQNVLGFILLSINLYFIGLLDNAAMTAGLGLATTFIHVCGMSLMIGTNIA